MHRGQFNIKNQNTGKKSAVTSDNMEKIHKFLWSCEIVLGAPALHLVMVKLYFMSANFLWYILPSCCISFLHTVGVLSYRPQTLGGSPLV